MQIIYDGRKVQVWEFVSHGLNIGKWSTGKHYDGVAVVKNVKTIIGMSRRWHPSFKGWPKKVTFILGIMHQYDHLTNHRTMGVKWGKASHLFSWVRGGETMNIELFINPRTAGGRLSAPPPPQVFRR